MAVRYNLNDAAQAAIPQRLQEPPPVRMALALRKFAAENPLATRRIDPRPRRTANREEESMSTLSHPEIIGLKFIACAPNARGLRGVQITTGELQTVPKQATVEIPFCAALCQTEAKQKCSQTVAVRKSCFGRIRAEIGFLLFRGSRRCRTI